jgi:hypothetical protein
VTGATIRRALDRFEQWRSRLFQDGADKLSGFRRLKTSFSSSVPEKNHSVKQVDPRSVANNHRLINNRLRFLGGGDDYADDPHPPT